MPCSGRRGNRASEVEVGLLGLPRQNIEPSSLQEKLHVDLTGQGSRGKRHRGKAESPETRSGGFGSLSPAPLALGIKMIRIQRPRAMISWHEPCLDPPWALLPLEPRVRPLVGHFGLASIGTERTPHRPAYIIG